VRFLPLSLFPPLINVTLCRCHLGESIVYDTVSNLSWAVDVRTHGIINIIENVLAKEWAPAVEIGREVPEAKSEDDCVVCVPLPSVVSVPEWELISLVGMLQLGVLG
jgi:putative lipase involved disintegration of autophagic bodies